MKVLFVVQVWVCDQWMTLEGAEGLERHEAHALYHQEVLIAGHERARMQPAVSREMPK